VGAGGQLYLVSPHDWPFLRHHPRCRSFKTLADAVVAIMAQQAGERAREQAIRSLASDLEVARKEAA
jgi:hypothetical protein